MTQAAAQTPRQQDEFGFLDEFETLTRFRQNVVRNRMSLGPGPETTHHESAEPQQKKTDFLDVISLICEVYQSYDPEKLLPMEHFQRIFELAEDSGHTCIVTTREVTNQSHSLTTRGETTSTDGQVIIKRARLKKREKDTTSTFREFIRELRVRSHPPLRNHPNIVNLRGVAWDFEDDEDMKPVPLLLEEFAPHRSLETFWREQELMQMPFATKFRLCMDIGEGIKALHGCGIGHGDVKPANILIFPGSGNAERPEATAAEGVPFTAKLTDFGHSVFRSDEDPSSLPVWTPLWSAPEVSQEHGVTSFEGIMAADIYSYGLVAASILVGKSVVSSGFKGLETSVAVSMAKSDDTLMHLIFDAVVEEDRDKADSDFDLGAIKTMLDYCLTKQVSLRSLDECLQLIGNHELAYSSRGAFQPSSWEVKHLTQPILGLVSTDTPLIGYHTLSRTSYLLKSKIVAELLESATKGPETRRPACSWELFICYFSGFGVEKNWVQAQQWLTKAAFLGVTSAQAYYYRLHCAMDRDPLHSIRNHQLRSCLQDDTIPVNAAATLGEWLAHAISSGCVDVVQDLRQLDQLHGSTYLPLALKILGQSTGEMHGLGHEQNEILAAAMTGDVQHIQSALASNPAALANAVNVSGNDALLLAAKYCNADVLRFLLRQPGVKLNRCNKDQQTVLHFMSIFDAPAIQELVPLLVEKGADIGQEGTPTVVYSSEAPNFSLPPKYDALTNAVLCRNMVLLETLLSASHGPRSRLACWLCRGGTRIRKMLAVASVLHSYEVLEIVERHLRLSGTNVTTWLECMQVKIWYRNELIPLHQTPFHGLLLGGMDLPKSLLRAVYHGSTYAAAVPKTLGIILGGIQQQDYDQTLYNMITASVQHDAADSLDYLMKVSGRLVGGLSISEYAMTHSDNFYENPLFVSIRLGFRDVFSHLVGAGEHSDANNLGLLVTKYACKRSCCRTTRRKRHVLNMTQSCLSVAVTADHRDTWFVTHILRECQETLVLAPPSEADEEITGQPSAFMAQAILIQSRRASCLIVDKYPALLNQLVHQVHVDRRVTESKSYARITTHWTLNRDMLSPGGPTPLSNFIFFIGSSDNVQLLQDLVKRAGWNRLFQQDSSSVLQTLAPSYSQPQDPELARGHMIHQTRAGQNNPDNQAWRENDYMLTPTEIHWLLLGLIAGHDRPDRYSLWWLVQRQLELQAKTNNSSQQEGIPHIDMYYYLRLAVRYGNWTGIERICQISSPAAMIQRHRLSERLFSVADLALCILRGDVPPFPAQLARSREGEMVIFPQDKESWPEKDEAFRYIASTLTAHSFKHSRLFQLIFHYSSPRKTWLVVFLFLSLFLLPMCILLPATYYQFKDPISQARTQFQPPGRRLHPGTVLYFLLLSTTSTLATMLYLGKVIRIVIVFTPLGGFEPRTFPSYFSSWVRRMYLRYVAHALLGVGYFIGLLMILVGVDEYSREQAMVALADPTGLSAELALKGLYVFVPVTPVIIIFGIFWWVNRSDTAGKSGSGSGGANGKGSGGDGADTGSAGSTDLGGPVKAVNSRVWAKIKGSWELMRNIAKSAS
ncbi:hypothetical protein V8F06_013911 [Rhypophila decipiens]